MIHPLLPERIPCYDLSLITELALGPREGVLRALPTFLNWRAVWTRSENVFTAVCWPAITTNSTFMRANCSPQSQLREGLMGLAPPYGLATHCPSHCRMCVALDISVVLTWRHPLLPPPQMQRQFPKNIQLRVRVALVTALKRTSHDTSWRQPCITCLALSKTSWFPKRCS